MNNTGNPLGGSPMTLDCPLCKKRGKHHVSETPKEMFHWNEERVEYFTRIAGMDMTYRKRERKCTFCGKEFATIETPLMFLQALMKDIETKERVFSKQLNEKLDLMEKIEKLEKAIEQSSKILSNSITE